MCVLKVRWWRVRAWPLAVLLLGLACRPGAQAPSVQIARNEVGAQSSGLVDVRARLSQLLEPWDGSPAREILDQETIQLFIRAGQPIIPDLMAHIRDSGRCRLVFSFPTSSYIPSERMLGGEVACYLIEAVLRNNPYFTTTARFLVDGKPCPDGLEWRGRALSEAAEQYEDWYRRCFDRLLLRSSCAADDLPTVRWDYDWNAWPNVKRLFAE
jgi:hypothetical protein